MKYQYRCNNAACSQIFEQQHPIDFVGVVLCPQCQSPAHKIISAPTVVLDWKLSNSGHRGRGKGRVGHAVSNPILGR